MGKLKSKVRYAIRQYLNDELSKRGLQNQITEIIRDFERRIPKKLLCQDIGLIVEEREQNLPSKSDKFKSIWALLDRVEPRIREALTNWKEVMSE